MIVAVRSAPAGLAALLAMLCATCAAAPSPMTAAHGRLEGTVTLQCAPAAPHCDERPYQMDLMLQGPYGGQPVQVHVSRAGNFAISLAPGTYAITSADRRGACCLPVLEPIKVTVLPGRTLQLHVRFEPGLQLPTR